MNFWEYFVILFFLVKYSFMFFFNNFLLRELNLKKYPDDKDLKFEDVKWIKFRLT